METIKGRKEHNLTQYGQKRGKEKSQTVEGKTVASCITWEDNTGSQMSSSPKETGVVMERSAQSTADGSTVQSTQPPTGSTVEEQSSQEVVAATSVHGSAKRSKPKPRNKKAKAPQKFTMQ